MGRCCNGLMVAFRVVQVILSIVALSCASYILYQMMSLSDTARDLQITLGEFVNATEPDLFSDSDLDALHDEAKGAQKVLNPLLDFLQGTPARAITLTAVSAWSVVVIIYLLVAQGRAAKNPGMNRRAVRVTLEIFTLFFWIGGIVSAALLAIQFGPLALLGGAQAKIFTTILRKVLKNNMDDSNNNTTSSAPNSNKALDQSLELVDDLLTIGILAILAGISSVICGMVSFVSCIAACCISGKAATPKPQYYYHNNNRTPYGGHGQQGAYYDAQHYHSYDPARAPPPPQKDPVYMVKEVGSPNSWLSSPPRTPAFYNNPGYHAVSTYDYQTYDAHNGRPVHHY